ncbi:MAG: exonuclease subunit SbcD [Clostridiales bacterium]|nr:exonuclease subunit SbcD [Clostridiales bacterium]
MKKKVIPIKIAHISDIHQGLGYPGPSPSSRFEDINRILDWTADRIIAEKVDLCLICGDLYKDAKVMFDRGTEETICVGNWLRKLSSAGIEVIVISGTPGHDSLAGYKFLEQMQIPHVSIRTQPGIIPYIPEVSIACLPGLNRSALLTQDEYKGLPPEQVHRIMTDKISQLCMGMSAQMPDDKPKILMAHITYQGADTGFADLLMQNEPILTREAVSGFDLVCLGHIHRPQQIEGKVFYPGPIERLSFNEEDITPGFWIHEISDISNSGNTVESEFIETPARRFYTIEWNETAILHFLNHGTNGFNSSFADSIRDAIVRLHYSCSEEIAKQINRKALEQSLYDAGCFYVSEIKADVQRVDRARDTEVTESLTPVDAVAKWADNQGIEPEESKALCAMTAELLESGV